MKTAACMIVKNEESSIAEWMAYHLAIGFETLLVFNNASSDGTVSIIDRYAARYDVRRIDWVDTSARYQMMAYDAALACFSHEFDWICFIDSDEFIVPLRHSSIGAFLESLPEAAAVAMNWAIFGSSGYVSAPDGLLTESFLRRSDAGFGVNKHVKSIVRPSRTQRSENPHFFVVDGPYVMPDGSPVCWESPGVTLASPSFDIIQVNHYFIKSAQQWAAKMRRGYHDVTRTGSEFAAYDRNEVEDHAALRYLQATKAILQANVPD